MFTEQTKGSGKLHTFCYTSLMWVIITLLTINMGFLSCPRLQYAAVKPMTVAEAYKYTGSDGGKLNAMLDAHLVAMKAKGSR